MDNLVSSNNSVSAAEILPPGEVNKGKNDKHPDCLHQNCGKNARNIMLWGVSATDSVKPLSPIHCSRY
jgi:hypothetical protein